MFINDYNFLGNESYDDNGFMYLKSINTRTIVVLDYVIDRITHPFGTTKSFRLVLVRTYPTISDFEHYLAKDVDVRVLKNHLVELSLADFFQLQNDFARILGRESIKINVPPRMEILNIISELSTPKNV